MSLFKADKKSFQGLYPLPLGNLRHASADQVGFEKPIPGIRFQTKLSPLCSLPAWISCTGCLLYCTQHNVGGGEDDILKATRYQNRSALPPRLTLHHNSAHWLERKKIFRPRVASSQWMVNGPFNGKAFGSLNIPYQHVLLTIVA